MKNKKDDENEVKNESGVLVDLSEVSPWCLFPVLEELDPFQISKFAQTSNEFADVCTSQCLWEDKYKSTYQNPVFKLSKSEDNADWISRYGKRSAISYNIANHKPKVKSFKGAEINKVRFFSNSFAFLSKDSLSIIGFDYFDNNCEYENIKTFPIEATDFMFLDEKTIITVNSDIVSMIKIDTGQISAINKEIGELPMIHRVSANLFAVVTSNACYIYDTRDISEPKCRFKHSGVPICVDSKANMLFIATKTDLTAHDISYPLGPILWNVVNRDTNKQHHCSINTKAGYAVYGNSIVYLLSGRIVALSIVDETVDCSCVLENKIAVLGCGKKVIYYDINARLIVGEQTFGEDELIKYICSSSLNNRVVIAGDYTVHIVDPHYDDAKFLTSEIRNPLKCGSVGMRKLDNFGIMRQVLFDGERLVANMGDFVRVYDFYTGKSRDFSAK